MKFYISEFGKHTPCKNFNNAIQVFSEKKLDITHKGVLWVKGLNRLECNSWIKQNKKLIDHDHMRVYYLGRGGRNWEWCFIDKVWSDWNNEDRLREFWGY